MDELTLHINAQELLAALYGVKTFARDHTSVHILLLTDNMTTVAHINCLGGTKSRILVQIVRFYHKPTDGESNAAQFSSAILTGKGYKHEYNGHVD